MTDIRADDLEEGDRLPWLEAVDEDEGGDGPSALKLIVAVLIGLVAIGGIVGGLFWLGNRDGSATRVAETIPAPPGPYKVKPDQPGGMHVEGQGDSSFAASAGADPRGNIDTNALPETPVTRGAAAHHAVPKAPAEPAHGQNQTLIRPAAQPAHAEASHPQAAHPQAPHSQVAAAAPGKLLHAPPPTNAPPTHAAAASAGTSGGNVQLGAFSSNAGAEKAWKALSGRFSYLAPLTHKVVTVSAGGKTLYRLRAAGAGADGVCGRLKVAGESCVTVD